MWIRRHGRTASGKNKHRQEEELGALFVEICYTGENKRSLRMAEVREFFGTGESAIRPEKMMTDRKVAVAVMKHPTEEKFLCVRNRKFGWVDFVMGGIEGDETPVEAAERELVEETGYVNCKIVGELPEVYYDNFYAAHKDVNRHIEVHTVYGCLQNLAQKERSQEEADLADVLWIEIADLAGKLHTDAHRWDLERVLARTEKS